MAYTVLARRYRSVNFDQVIGQEHIAQTLKKAIDSGRIAHAYLFCGTRGTGKTSTARILAKALNCEKSDGPTSHPCGECPSCQAIARGEDMDVIEIDAASNTGVDNVRDIIENAQYRPARSRFKVYIIDEVHMLSKAAFNALLKTMEEPPSHVKFILATTEPEKVLPTILSRCQRYDFRNIPTQEIAKHLKNICQQEQIKADDDALLMVAKAGAGSMRDSLSLLDRLLSIGEKELHLEMIEQLLGLPRTQLIFDLVQAIGTGDVKATLASADRMLASGLSPDTLLASMVDHFRNLLILRTCGSDAGLVEVPGLSLKDLQAQADRFEPMTLTQDITILEELRRLLRQAMASRALLDATLVRLALSDQFASIAELLARTNGQPAAAGQKKKPELAHPAPAAPHSHPAHAAPAHRAPTHAAPVQHAPAPAPTASAPADGGVTLTPVPAPTVNTDLDLDDDLPRPGKVWDNSGPSLADMLKGQSGAPPGPPPPDSPPPDTVAAGTAHPDSNISLVNVHDLPTIWRNLLGALQQHGPALLALVQQGKFVGFDDDGVAIIRYDTSNSTFVKMLDRNGKKDLIRDALSKVLNRSVGIKFIVEDVPGDQPRVAGPAAGQRPAAPPHQPANPAHRVSAPEPAAPPPEPTVRLTPELRDQLRQDPLVKSVLETLGGDIIKIDPA